MGLFLGHQFQHVTLGYVVSRPFPTVSVTPFPSRQAKEQGLSSCVARLRDQSLMPVSFFFFFFYFILFLAVLGLHCCAQAFSSCGERGLLFFAVRRLLIAVASLIVEHGL